MKTIFNIFDSCTHDVIWWIAFLLVIIIAGINMLIGNVISLENILIFPIVLTSWYGSKKSGVLLSITAASIWVGASCLFTMEQCGGLQVLFNYIIQMTSYVFLSVFIANFREVNMFEKNLADTDSLTGLFNSRRIYVELADELLRAVRYKHVFSLAYIDIDNFKKINDLLGHAAGNSVLKDVALCLSACLRKVDKIGRIGGDEFLCLLPETNSESAKAAMEKAVHLLSDHMKSSRWNVTFSIGVVTFESPPESINLAISAADELMYKVKNKGKNNIFYKIV